jgi:hypothetical protein
LPQLGHELSAQLGHELSAIIPAHLHPTAVNAVFQPATAINLPAAHWSLAPLAGLFAALSPAASLAALSSLCDFTLEISLAYILCWLLARFATSPAIRFRFWTGFLLATGTCWLITLASLVRIVSGALPLSPDALLLSHTLSLPGVSRVGSWAALGRHWGAIHWGHSWVVPASLAQWIGFSLAILCVVYCAGLAYLSATSVVRRYRLARALAFRTPAPAALLTLLATVSADIGSPRVARCRLWLLPGLPSPATLGTRRPGIYLPPDCIGEDHLALADILRHELAHVRRRDSLWDLLTRLCRSLVFFHPAVHRASFSMRLERELASDRIVIRTQPDKRDRYADTLVRFGWRTTRRPKAIGISFAAGTSVLRARVQSILAGEPVYSLSALRLRGLLSAGAFALFTLTAPLLWVGFRLAQLPVTAAMATAALPRPAQPVPSIANHLHHGNLIADNALPVAPEETPTAPAGTNALQALSAGNPQPEFPTPALLSDLAPAALPTVRYQSQQPPALDASTSSPDLSTLAPPSAPSVGQTSIPPVPPDSNGPGAPSQSTIGAAVNTVVVLATIGGVHVHD